MLTKAFVDNLKELELVKSVDINSDVGTLRAYDYNNNVIFVILTKEDQSYNTMYPAFRRLKSDQRDILMKYILDYSSTPVSKRVEENKYIVPVIPKSLHLNGKFLFRGRLGLSIRDLTKKELSNPDLIDSRFIFSEHKIKQFKDNHEINIRFDNIIKL